MTARERVRARAMAVCLAVAALGAPAVADAAVVSATPGAALSATPVTVSLGGSAASFAFTAVPVTGNGPGAAVATGGTGLVSTFFGGVTDFFSGASIDGSGLFTFAAYPTAALIPDSPADDFIGLAFTLADGLHFGYAEVNGALLVSYGFESTPGATILTGATAVPEPASGALAAVALAAIGVFRSRRMRVKRDALAA